MPNTLFFRLRVAGILLPFVLLSFSSCRSLFTRTFVETDEVKSTTRTRKEIYYRNVRERRTPFYSSTQTWLKEEAEGKPSTYSVYEIMKLDPRGFSLKDTLYLLVNDDYIYPVKINKRREQLLIQDEITGSATEVDSTSVKLTFSKDENRILEVRFSYSLHPEVIDRMKTAEKVGFRYYAGPNMMTTRMPGPLLRQWQKVMHE